MTFNHFVVEHSMYSIPVRDRLTFGLEMESRGRLIRVSTAEHLLFGGDELERVSRVIGGNDRNESRCAELRGRFRLLRGLRIIVLEVIGVDGNTPRMEISNPLSTCSIKSVASG